MAIRLIDRMTRLVAADAHGLVESLEDRALLLKQHLREAELALQHKRARCEALAEEERSLADTAHRLEEALRGADEDARLALAEDRDDLARFAIRKWIPKRRELAALQARMGELSEERRQLEEKRREQERQLEELRARVRAHLAAPHCAQRDVPAFGDAGVADEEVEMELLRRKRAGGEA